MNRVFAYSCSIFGLLTVVVIANYICYHAAIKQFESRQETYDQKITEKVEDSVSRQMETRLSEFEEQQQENVTVESTEEKLNVQTVYQIENYDAQKGQTTTEYETVPEEFIGFNREEADAYFKKYMQNLPVEEFLNGLQSVGITAFSSERMVVHKIYDSSKIKYRYYLIAIEGEVVVYYGDKKTVYEYTGIETKELSQEEQKALKKGVEIKDEDELFGILENYSS